MSRQINLYDPALLRRRDWLTLGNVVAAAVLALGGVAGWGALGASKAAGLQARLDGLAPRLEASRNALAAASRALATRTPDAAIEGALASARSRAALSAEALSILERGTGPQAPSFAEYLRALARQAGGGLWLTGFSVRPDAGAMEIHGRMLDPSALPDYIGRLGGERAFRGQSFFVLRIQAPDGAPAPPFVEFSLAPQPKAPAPAGGDGR